MPTLTYGTVTGTFGDTLAAEVVPITGSLTFTPEPAYLLSAETAAKAVILPTPKTVSLVNGAFTVELLGTDNASLNPLEWTYRVDFSLSVNGKPISRKPISIEVPSGVSTDLADIAPVVASEGGAVVRGLKGDTGEQGVQGIQGVPGVNATNPAFTASATTGAAGTNAAVALTGSYPNLNVGLTIPRGDKGDPGGFVSSTILGSVSLDTVTTAGLYFNPIANAAAAPSGIAGHLEVIFGANWILQRYTNYDNPRSMWVRRRDSAGNWQAWRTWHSSRWDTTTGRVLYEWDNVNNREQIVYGDTGARSIGDLLVNGWVTTATNVVLQRTGNIVTLNGQFNSTAATSAVLYTLPTGFRPKTPNAVPINAQVAGSTLKWAFARWDGQLQCDIATTSNNLLLGGSWSSTDAWPTTLPGAANGTIPNI